MKSSLVRAALACLALALSATAGLAAPGDPVPGTEVGLEGDPESIVVAHGVTNDKGQITFGNVAPGKPPEIAAARQRSRRGLAINFMKSGGGPSPIGGTKIANKPPAYPPAFILGRSR